MLLDAVHCVTEVRVRDVIRHVTDHEEVRFQNKGVVDLTSAVRDRAIRLWVATVSWLATATA